MSSSTPSASSVTHTGTLATMRGAGRPWASAASCRAGAMSVSMVRGPLSQRMSPSVCAPAISSMRGPMAASITDGTGTSGGPPSALGLRRPDVTLVRDLALPQRREQHREVLLHVPGRPRERDLERPLDRGLVREPDAQHQPSLRELRRGQRLRREHERVTGPRGDDRGAQLDGRRRLTHHARAPSTRRARRAAPPSRSRTRPLRPAPHGRRSRRWAGWWRSGSIR